MRKFTDIFMFTPPSRRPSPWGNWARLLTVWCPLSTLVFTLGFNGYENFGENALVAFVISGVVGSVCYLGSWMVHEVLAARAGHVRKSGGARGVFISCLFLLPGLWLGFETAAGVCALIGFAWTPPGFTSYSSGVLFGVMIAGLFFLMETIRDAGIARRDAALREEKLENEKLKAQVSALTAQMNPHLLFNALNTVAATIGTDPESAEDMLVRLSELYRGILKSARGDTHSLAEELELCRNYLEIESKRFGPRVRTEIEIEDGLDLGQVQVPILLLQPLVENAVKHGISPKAEGGSVRLGVRRAGEMLDLIVADDGVGPGRPGTSARGNGSALANCEARLKLKYGDLSTFSFVRTPEGETVAHVRLPWNSGAPADRGVFL